MSFTKKLTFGFGVLALGIASAASGHLTISDPTWVGGAQLQPGDYTVEMNGSNAVIKGHGKENRVQVAAKVEQADRKFSETSVISASVNGKETLEEIRLRGTNTRIVVQNPPATAGSE